MIVARDSIFAFGKNLGAIAQLGERLLCKQEVRSSILLGSILLRSNTKVFERSKTLLGSTNPP